MEDLAIYMTEAYYLVVADDQVLNQINDMQAKAYGGNGSQINTEFVLDMDGTDEEKNWPAIKKCRTRYTTCGSHLK